MSDDRTIMEMMEEMETYFKERDNLFRQREEAYEKRYEDLVRRESSVKEAEEELERSRKDHCARLEELHEKEQEILLKDADLKEKTETKEEEYRRLKKKLQEDQLRLNLLETKLQNESLKAQTSRLRYESEKAETGKNHFPVLPCCLDTDLHGEPSYHTLEEENEKLKSEASVLRKKIVAETKKRETVEKEKKELLKILLKTDPEASRLLDGEKEYSTAWKPGTLIPGPAPEAAQMEGGNKKP